MEEIQIIVHGKVQNVSFRLNTRKTALDLGITGRVWNRKDGTVEIVAQGDHELLEKLLNWTRIGEGRAVVDQVEFKYRKTGTIYEDFLVLRLRKALIATTAKEIPTIIPRA